MKKEFIQYIAKTHVKKKDVKDSAVYNKRNCSRQKTLYMKAMSFEEIVEAQTEGLTIGRIYPETSFIVIDIDMASFPYTVINDIYSYRTDIRASMSASGKAHRFHIFVDMHDEIITEDRYADAVKLKFEEISEDVKAFLIDYQQVIFEIDECSYEFWHCFFGAPQSEIYEIVLQDSVRLMSWKRKTDAEPYIWNDKNINRAHMSLSSAEYCYLNGLMTVHESERYDIVLPSRMGKNKFRIGVGHRWKWCGMMIPRLILRAKHLENEFDEKWNSEDLAYTFRNITAQNVDLPSEFLSSEDFKSQLDFLEKSWNRVKNLPFDIVKGIYAEYIIPKRRDYKCKGYNSIKLTDLIQSLCEITMDNNKRITFRDRDALMSWCERNKVPYRWTLAELKRMKIEVKYEKKTKRVDSSEKLFRKYDKDEKGRYLIPKTDMCQKLRNRASKLKLKLKVLK